MAGFLYYIPSTNPTTDMLRAVGFPWWRLAVLPGRGVKGGPDGSSGFIFTIAGDGLPSRPNDMPGYYPQRQQWHPSYVVGGEATIWIGFDTTSPPTPDDLKYVELPDGYPLRLADGNEWIIPIVRMVSGEPNLPRVYMAEGKKLKPDHETLFQTACRIWEAIFKGTEYVLDDALGPVTQAMGQVYRLSKAEALALGLFDETTLKAAARLMVDYPGWMAAYQELTEEAQKKSGASEVSDS